MFDRPWHVEVMKMRKAMNDLAKDLKRKIFVGGKGHDRKDQYGVAQLGEYPVYGCFFYIFYLDRLNKNSPI